ncbi:MAG: germination protein YpeB, partial [Eubacteriales bacterium]|nr:germination protein YpeB [Eubacteriales bacterium]
MKKRTANRIITLLTAAVIALGAVSVYQYNRAEDYRRMADAGYQRAFSELCTSVSGLDTALQKAQYATSPTMISAVCTEIFGKAMTAQMSLGVLPLSTQELEQTAGFISRVGDYAYSLSRLAAQGAPYTKEQL